MPKKFAHDLKRGELAKCAKVNNLSQTESTFYRGTDKHTVDVADSCSVRALGRLRKYAILYSNAGCSYTIYNYQVFFISHFKTHISYFGGSLAFSRKPKWTLDLGGGGQGGGGTGIEGAESGVEGAESGVEGAGSGSRGGGKRGHCGRGSGKIGGRNCFFLLENS